MEQAYFSMTLAGVPLAYRPVFFQTPRCFGGFYQPWSGQGPVISLTAEELAQARPIYPPDMRDEALEFNVLTAKTSDALLPFDRCLFHGVAFLWREKAWIFTAPSGTGKSTQYVLWKILYGQELTILNGDKPALECRPDGQVWVHPSPWTGKEGMGRLKSAPLGGVIYLSQGQENAIAPLPLRQAVIPIFSQFLFTASTPAAVRQVAAIEERLLRAAPVWRLQNRGDEASARLTHDTILHFEEGRL